MDLLTELRTTISKQAPFAYLNSHQEPTRRLEEAVYVVLAGSVFESTSAVSFPRTMGGENYTLLGVCFCYEKRALPLSAYLQECKNKKIPVVSAVDRKRLLSALTEDTFQATTTVPAQPAFVLTPEEQRIRQAVSRENPLQPHQPLHSRSQRDFLSLVHELGKKLHTSLETPDTPDVKSSLVSSLTQKIAPERSTEREFPGLIVLSASESIFSLETIKGFIEKGVYEKRISFPKELSRMVVSPRTRCSYELLKNPQRLSPEQCRRVVVVLAQEGFDRQSNWRSLTQAPVIWLSLSGEMSGSRIVLHQTKQHLNKAAQMRFLELLGSAKPHTRNPVGVSSP